MSRFNNVIRAGSVVNLKENPACVYTVKKVFTEKDIEYCELMGHNGQFALSRFVLDLKRNKQYV